MTMKILIKADRIRHDFTRFTCENEDSVRCAFRANDAARKTIPTRAEYTGFPDDYDAAVAQWQRNIRCEKAIAEAVMAAKLAGVTWRQGAYEHEVQAS